MVIGDPCKFGFIIERIREWEASGTYQSGIVFLFLDNTIYPDTVRNTTLNVDLYHLTRDDSPFMNPVIDPDLYELEKDKLFKTLYAEDMETDQEYTGTLFKDTAFDNVYSDRILRTRAWGRLYRRTEIGGLRYVPGTEPLEDAYFNELLYRKNMKIRVTDQQLYYYYMRPDSAIHSHLGRGAFNSIGPLLERLEKIDDPAKRGRIITRCYKYVLSARYGEMFSDDYADVKRRCRELLQKLAPYSSELPTKQKLIVRALSASPLLYRAWRIKDDPTLLAYEKRLKQERCARKQR